MIDTIVIVVCVIFFLGVLFGISRVLFDNTDRFRD